MTDEQFVQRLQPELANPARWPEVRAVEDAALQCSYFGWILIQRGGTYYADGRSNQPNAGRHSLGTSERSEAFKALPLLDRSQAERLGLAPASDRSHSALAPLGLYQGRKLYEEHIARPRTTGGVRPSTRKRYRTVFDKFSLFAGQRGVKDWNSVDAMLLTAYASHLDKKGYAGKTLQNELVTLKQAYKWFIKEGHLQGKTPLDLKIRKVESQRAYCWRPGEVRAIVDHCQARPNLRWLHAALVALVHTGLRIAELASLRWSDLDLEQGILSLTDESGRGGNAAQRRELKSGRSRQFPIHGKLLEVFTGLQRHSDSYVFHGPRGGRLKPDTVRRVLVREVLQPLSEQFPGQPGTQSFQDGRLHSFRHYFCSACANSGQIPEQMLMTWLGHKDSEMVRHYYHLHDEESRRRMNKMDFLGGLGGRSAEPRDGVEEGGAEPAA